VAVHLLGARRAPFGCCAHPAVCGVLCGLQVRLEAGSLLVFRHPLIRQALYEAVPAGLRSALHRQVAQALADAGAPTNRVAEQIVAAEDVTDSWVVDWITSARQELARRAPSIAADLLRRAVEEIAAGDPRREPLEAQLVVVLRLLARHDEVARLAEEVLLRDPGREHRARITWSLAFTLMYTGRTDEALDATDQALANTEPGDPWIARMRALRAVLLVYAGRFDEGAPVAEQALAESEQTGDHRAMALTLQALAFGYSTRDAAASLAFLDRGVAVPGDDVESIDRRFVLLGNRISHLMRMDRWADVDFVAVFFDTLGQDATLHRLWYDLRNQSLFDEPFRADVLEIDSHREAMVWRVISRYAELRGGELGGRRVRDARRRLPASTSPPPRRQHRDRRAVAW
jgi:tetratricopeptide (TPR) repeat protein